MAAEGEAEVSERMNEAEMKTRTKAFALRVIRLTEALPKTRTSDVIGRQLLRAGTSVGANYRAVRRARSKADFINKLGVVLEEADECGFWMELLVESDQITMPKVKALIGEADEITAILVATIRTAKGDR